MRPAPLLRLIRNLVSGLPSMARSGLLPDSQLVPGLELPMLPSVKVPLESWPPRAPVMATELARLLVCASWTSEIWVMMLLVVLRTVGKATM